MNIKELLINLSAPIPPKYISQRRQGGSTIKYISWTDYVEILNQRVGLGSWSWSIQSVTQTSPTSQINGITEDRQPFIRLVGSTIVVIGTLTLFGDDRTLQMSATGEEIANCSSYGTSTANAEATAFRRAIAKTGCSIELWKK
jgi:hypothetical protein